MQIQINTITAIGPKTALKIILVFVDTLCSLSELFNKAAIAATLETIALILVCRLLLDLFIFLFNKKTRVRFGVLLAIWDWYYSATQSRPLGIPLPRRYSPCSLTRCVPHESSCLHCYVRDQRPTLPLVLSSDVRVALQMHCT
jgi:hypothetical protein